MAAAGGRTVICLFGCSALEALRAARACGQAPSRMPRTARLDACGIPHLANIEDELCALGAVSRPVHALVANDGHSHTTRGIVRHIMRAVPPRSLVRLGEHVLASGPELCFLQLAGMEPMLNRARRALPARSDAPRPDTFAATIDLALIGFELCGGYRMDPADPEGLSSAREPLTSKKALLALLERTAGTRGVALARKAAALVQDGARSPAEAALALLFCAPRRLGGLGFPPGVCNLRVQTAQGVRYIDHAFPEHGVGLEYQGVRYHGLDAVRRDDRRQNELAAAGMTIFTVWSDDLSDPALFDHLAHEVARAMGLRLRIRDADFRHRQALLRARVLPPVTRYDDMVS